MVQSGPCFGARPAHLLSLLATWTAVVVLSVQHITGTALKDVSGRVDRLHAELEHLSVKNGALLSERDELADENARLQADLSSTDVPVDPHVKGMLNAAGYDSHADFAGDSQRHEEVLDEGMTAGEIALHKQAVARQKELGFAGFDWAGPERKHVSRKLASLMKIGTTSSSGCFAFDVSATTSVDVSGTNCNSNRCPPCMVLSGAAATFTVSNCASALVVSGTALSSQMLGFDFINTATNAAHIVTVTDGTNSFRVGAGMHVTAFCSSVANNNLLYFPTTKFCSSGCDAATPTNEAGSAFSTVQMLTAATAVIAETWTTNSAGGGYCPRGCDVAVPNYDSGSAFGTVKMITAATQALVETWGTTSAGNGYCPRGCDAVIPNYGNGNAFTVAKGMTAAVAGFLTTNAPTANVVWNTAATSCTSGEQVCMSR